jgi:hypothetical protein
MKTVILIFLFGFYLITAKSQDYHPMLSDSCEWYISFCSEGCWTRIFSTRGDTTFNNKKYFKYFLQWTHIKNSIEHIGYLHEDTLAKKIYYRHSNCNGRLDTSDFLYYDFNLDAGDSILLGKPPEEPCHNYDIFDTLGWYQIDTVLSISILIGERKIFYLHRIKEIEWDRDNYLIWIEGIGLANSFYNKIDLEYMGDPWLNCFFRGDNNEYKWTGTSWHYPQGETPCDLIIEGLPKKSMDEFSINYLKNINTILIARNYQFNSKLIYISIYDINGKEIRANSTYDDLIKINISDFKQGLYIIEVINDNKRFINKIVK